MIVHYSDIAIEDLVQVWSNVFAVSGDALTADRYSDEILKTIEEKSAFPLSSVQIVHKGIDTGIRMIPYKAYLIFYQIRNGMMEIGRILPAKSDYLHLLYDEKSKSILMEDVKA